MMTIAQAYVVALDPTSEQLVMLRSYIGRERFALDAAVNLAGRTSTSTGLTPGQG